MKIILIGYGKMGHLVEDIAKQKDHQIVARIQSSTSIAEQQLKEADLCIDFSTPESVLQNVHLIAKSKKNIVMGTTGWYDQMEEVKKIVKEHDIGFLFSPNFSVGLHLFRKIVENAAQLINDIEEYDVAGYEIHHNQKADSPSGTAKSLMDNILQKIKRKKNPLYEMGDRQITPEELHFTSIRCGFVPGTHTLIFDSPADTITLTHQARNREGFARGAVTAAEWLVEKKGFFTLDDIIR